MIMLETELRAYSLSDDVGESDVVAFRTRRALDDAQLVVSNLDSGFLLELAAGSLFGSFAPFSVTSGMFIRACTRRRGGAPPNPEVVTPGIADLHGR